MRKLLIALILIGLLAAPLQAADWWNTTVAHKSAHVIAGGGIAFGVGAVSHKPWLGFAAGCGAGFAKEAYDHTRGESFKSSAVDIGITCGAAGLGAWAAKWWVKRHLKKR